MSDPNDPRIEGIEITNDNQPSLPPLPPPPGTPEPAVSRLTRFKQFLGTHRTRVIIVLGLLIITPVVAWSYMNFTKPVTEAPKKVIVKKKPPAPTTKPSPLTGIEIEPALADRPISGVVIENHPDARPQSGLSSAGIVYEALAEGGITRFLAFFLDERPPSIGPVRSLRPYFVDWTLEFNSPVIHAGGSAEALGLIEPLHVKSLNALGRFGGYFSRAGDRYAPHNLYTTSDSLDKLLADTNNGAPSNFAHNPRSADKPAATPPHAVIHIDYSYTGFQVEYRYNQGCNCYDRFLAGAPHIDRNTGAQIQAKNVVVEYMPTSYDATGHAIMSTPGSGQAIVFRDGEAITGTWSKSVHEERTKLKDAAGKEIPLAKGKTWFAIVPVGKTVSY